MVTLRDIAAQTGMSVSSVSHILNGRGSQYNRQTCKRVAEVAQKLGYSPNRHAQITRGGRSGIIGMIQHVGLLQVAVIKGREVSRAFRDTPYRLLTSDAEWTGPAIETACQTMLDLRVEGLVLVDPPSVFPLGLLKKFHANRIPVVALGGKRLSGVPQVRTDMCAGMCTLTRHVLGLGHRSLELLVPQIPPDAQSRSAGWSILERIEGFREAVREAGLDNRQARLRYAGSPNDLMLPHENGRRAMETLLTEKNLSDVLMFSNDDWAIGALSVCAEAGIRVPQDIAVTGFDNAPIGAYAVPPLTTFAQDYPAMAAKAVEILLKYIHSGKMPGGRASVFKLPGTLVIRRSCGAATRLSSAAS